MTGLIGNGREVPKKWTHRVHTVTPGDSVGTIFWVVSPLNGEPIRKYHWKETMATNPRFSVIYFQSVVFFLLGSLIIIPCARTCRKLRRYGGDRLSSMQWLHWCERRSALHERPSGVRARSITFVFRCGIQGLVCSLEARFSLCIKSSFLTAACHVYKFLNCGHVYSVQPCC
jgi:hypothetical protein